MLLANRQNTLPKGHALHPEVSVLTVPSPSINTLKTMLVKYTNVCCTRAFAAYYQEIFVFKLLNLFCGC